MTKHDWLHLFIKALGLYMVITHIPTLVTTTFTLVTVMTQNPNPALAASTIYLWQGPIVSTLSACLGLLLISQTDALVRFLQKSDEK